MSVRPEPGAELRVLRLLTVGIGVSSALLIALRPDATWRPTAISEWFWFAQLLSLLVPVAAGAASPWLGIRSLRRVNAVGAIASLSLIPAVVLLNATMPPDDRHLPWVLTAYGPSAVASLIAWGPRAAWWLLAVAVLGTQAIRFWSDSFASRAGVNDIQALLTAVALLALSGLLLATTRDADRQAVLARARETRRSAEAARDEARERAAALVHDEVLATLLLAARATGPVMRAAVERHAARAVRLIRELGGSEDRATVPTERLIARLGEAAAQEDPAARFEAAPTRAIVVPPAAVAALAGALRQALANSVAHAGPEARRSVRVDIGDDGIRVRVRDDGVGFDPTAPSRDRMGIAVSIVGRMEALPGGEADVDSRPGRGTTVTLRWEPRSPDVALPVDDGRQWLWPASTAETDWRRRLLLPGVFVVGQVGLAALALTADAEDPGRVALALVGLLIALGLVWGRPLTPPSLARSGAAVAVLTGTAALSWFAVSAERIDYVDLWYLTSAALVLVALAVGGRPGLAVLGVMLSTAVVTGGIAVAELDATDATSALARPVVNAVLGALLVVGIRWAYAATARFEAAELAQLQARSWGEARRAELLARSRELDALIGRSLERIATGRALTDADRRECVALEGRLRDHYRGGRLARAPLIDAAMAARARGVDVCLLDDAAYRLGERDLERIAQWMRDQLDRVPDGPFTGRILPAGRDGVASVVAGDVSAVLAHGTRGAGDDVASPPAVYGRG